MLKYVNTEVVFREFPDEVTLAINISGCPNKCPGCHSSYLINDIGTDLTPSELDELIFNNPGITCVGFMGGDADPKQLSVLAEYIKENYILKVGWYTGRNYYTEDVEEFHNVHFPCKVDCYDYIKVGPYVENLGPLDKRTTNQRMYLNTKMSANPKIMIGEDITYKFWSDDKD